MSRVGFGAKAALVALVVLVGAALLPSAAADHSYSHRYVVYGRVVDANHDPVQGVTVDAGFDTIIQANLEGSCANQPDTDTEAYGRTQTVPVTNSFGEFMFCFHHHGLARGLPGKITIRVTEENYSRTFDVDPYFRMTQTVEVLDHVSAKANKTAFDQAYVIQGRLWTPAGTTTNVEGIGVFGTTVNNVPVNITFTHDGETQSFLTSTNNYGDFAFRANVTKRPTEGSVTIEAQGETHTYALDPKYGVTSVEIEPAKRLDPFVKGALIVGGIALVAIVVGGGGWYGYRKMNERREERAVRANATRRRANK